MEKITDELEIVRKKLVVDNQKPLSVPIKMNASYVEINRIIDSYLLLNKEIKSSLKFSDEVAWLLLGFGFYMATYSLRTAEQRYFTNGLTAIGIASKVIDLRDCLRLLVLYCDVSKKNKLSFEPVILQNNEFSMILKNFIERKEIDKTLECMEYVLIGEGENIQYMPKQNI